MARDYSSPRVVPDIQDIRFDFLICLDLCHATERNSLVKQVVINLART
ncbi:MAG TPA: hypothetical protein VKZ94_18570 [Advenella sp.]|nr:hypothetical protein [Advenella sp.]